MLKILIIIALTICILFISFNLSKLRSSYISSIEEYNRLKQQYSEDIQRTNNIDSMVKLAKLYHEGYNEIEPDALNAIYYYKLAIDNGYYIVLLDLGDIYNWGLPKFSSNQYEAEKMYRLLIQESEKINDSTARYYKELAKERLERLDEENGPFNDNYINYSTSFGFFSPMFNGNEDKFGFNSEVFKNVSTIGKRQTYPVKSKSNVSRANLINFTNHNERVYTDIEPIEDNFREFLVLPNANTDRIERPEFHLQVEKPYIRNDPQNVHDHSVVKSVNKSIYKIKEDTPLIKADEEVYNDLVDYIGKSDFNSNKKKNALESLKHIKNQKGLLTNGMSENEALHLVWNRIHSPINENQKDNLKQNLINELADCNNDGYVCAMGRFSRIVDSLNSVDPDVKIYSKWMIRNELMNKASKIREQLFMKLSPNEKTDIDSNEKGKILDDFQDKLKKEIREVSYNDYVSTGLMSKEIMDAELNQWINDI